MSDELKKIYSESGLSDRFFEGSTPIELWRAQSRADFKKEVFIMQPHPGYQKRNERGDVISPTLTFGTTFLQ